MIQLPANPNLSPPDFYATPPLPRAYVLGSREVRHDRYRAPSSFLRLRKPLKWLHLQDAFSGGASQRQRSTASLRAWLAMPVHRCGAVLLRASPGAGLHDWTPMAAALQDLQSQVRELKQLVLQLQQQTVASHAEITRLREELESRRMEAETSNAGGIAQPSPAYRLDYRASWSSGWSMSKKTSNCSPGRSTTNTRPRSRAPRSIAFASRESCCSTCLATAARSITRTCLPGRRRPHPMDSSGSVGGTMRQSILGFEAFGPDFLGAHTSANVNFDFGGGFPATDNGVNSGLVRLRTAAVRLDWKDTSVIAGQDQLFLSPIAPTSFASLIVPPLSYAGNLWAWTPQLRVEHRFALSGDSTIMLQGALPRSADGRAARSGLLHLVSRARRRRSSRASPAMRRRVGYSQPMLGQTFTVGAGGYYSRQNWGFDRMVNGWAGDHGHEPSAQPQIQCSAARSIAAPPSEDSARPWAAACSLTGRLSDPNTSVVALNVVGGWAQLKFRATPKLEFNGAFGQDSPFAADVRYFGDTSDSYAPFFLTGNRAAFGNVIYRPRSDLLMSVEYRRLRTFTIYDNSYEAGQFNMSMGVLILDIRMSVPGKMVRLALFLCCLAGAARVATRKACRLPAQLFWRLHQGHRPQPRPWCGWRHSEPPRASSGCSDARRAGAEEQGVRSASAGRDSRLQHRISQPRSLVPQRVLAVQRQALRPGTL